MRRLTHHLPFVALCAWLALSATPHARVLATAPPPTSASTPSPQPSGDGVGTLLQRIEQTVRSGNATGYQQMVAPGVDPALAAKFTDEVILPGVTRAVVRERDRVPLTGMTAGDGYRLAVDVFCEFGRRARLSTWRLDVVRREPKTTGVSGDEWAIRSHQLLSSFTALYNLALSRREYAAKNLVLTAEDMELRLPDGAVFVAETDEGPTVLVLLGRGQMVFKPSPEAERAQVKIFSDAEAIDTPFTAAFVRVAPSAVQAHVAAGTMFERALDPRDERAAAEVFRTDGDKSFGVSLGDLTNERWSLVPGGADFLAEVHTKRFGVLTYTRSAHEAEDVSLFDRSTSRYISTYASPWKLAQRGAFYTDDDQNDYDVLHYDVDVSLDPLRDSIAGVARLAIRVRTASATTLTFRLAESLAADSVVSREFGRVVAMRVRNQNSCLVNLPQPVQRGALLNFTIAYHGRIVPQMVDREAVSVEADPQQQYEDTPDIPIEPSYLYSNRNFWYPQAQTNGFATATLRIRVPAGYQCVASGDPDNATTDLMTRAGSGEFVFRALQPVRYLSVFVTRLTAIRTQVVAAPAAEDRAARAVRGPDGVFYPSVELRAFASPHMRGRAQPLAQRAGDVLQFYSSLVGDCPYPTLALALVERELPGGHSPGYAVVVSQPIVNTRLEWRNDPTSFPQFPEFFLAHEIAHQWWGQAIGWKNYHEQWLSEGLAQYFSALYAERLRGKDVFGAMIRRMQDWAVKKSGEGPIYLGYRVGHIKRDSQMFRAIVYNKSAVVLHMLRRFVGDDAFFAGLRRFYHDWRFQKAGSDDLRLAMEAESHRSLERFFDRWIYDSRLPRLKFSSRTETGAAGRPEVVLRFEQAGDLFDVPVTVTLEYQDRSPVDVLVQVTDAVTEMRVPLEGRLRGVEVNRDQAAIARIEK